MQMPLAFASLALPPNTHTFTHIYYLICQHCPVYPPPFLSFWFSHTHMSFDYKLKVLHLLFSCEQMSTKEKLISHVMKEQPIGCQNKVTVVGVGMVGMASAISILLKVRGNTLT